LKCHCNSPCQHSEFGYREHPGIGIRRGRDSTGLVTGRRAEGMGRGRKKEENKKETLHELSQ
jgi:hypothetical protein